ncbi:glycosyltransferase [Brevibacterium sp. UMB10442]|nr:glycosyltransferase [Brevibacterium sp. UMB10442]
MTRHTWSYADTATTELGHTSVLIIRGPSLGGPDDLTDELTQVLINADTHGVHTVGLVRTPADLASPAVLLARRFVSSDPALSQELADMMGDERVLEAPIPAEKPVGEWVNALPQLPQRTLSRRLKNVARTVPGANRARTALTRLAHTGKNAVATALPASRQKGQPMNARPAHTSPASNQSNWRHDPSHVREFDVIMATDCRFPGGSTASMVEEIEAQYLAGYRTAIMHLPSTSQKSLRPFADRISKVLREGKAELIQPHQTVRARTLVVRHPTLFNNISADLPQLQVDSTVMIANQVPVDDRAVQPYYFVEEVHRNATAVLGHEPVWAPISPVVRESLIKSWAKVPMLDFDWVNIVNMAAWKVERDGLLGDVPVIGRHSRGHWSKWPDTREDLLAAYPNDPTYKVKILGGTEAPEEILGGLPEHWVSLPFGSVPAREYLAGIDFLVYFHHPGMFEAFGRVVLEGIASGAVAIVGEAMRPIFGDSCLYGTPQDVTRIIDELVADPQALREQQQRGQQIVQERFSWDAHIKRLADFAGAPSEARREPLPSTPVTTLLVMPTSVPATNVSRALEWMRDDSQRAQHRGVGNGNVVACTPDSSADFEIPVETGPMTAARIAQLVTAHKARNVLVFAAAQGPHTQDSVASARELAATLGDDVDVYTLADTSAGSSSGSAGFSIDAEVRTRAADNAPWPVQQTRRIVGKAVSNARRDMPQWARPTAKKMLNTAVKVRNWQLQKAAGAGPVPSLFEHVSPTAPVGLLVIGHTSENTESVLDALLAHVEITSHFRPAVLAPREWLHAAQQRGIFCETLIPEDMWPEPSAVPWASYLEERIAGLKATAQVQAVALIDADSSVRPGTPTAAFALLSALTSER